MKIYILEMIDVKYGDKDRVGVFASEEEAKVMITFLLKNRDSRFMTEDRFMLEINEAEMGEIFPVFHEFFGIKT